MMGVVGAGVKGADDAVAATVGAPREGRPLHPLLQRLTEVAGERARAAGEVLPEGTVAGLPAFLHAELAIQARSD